MRQRDRKVVGEPLNKREIFGGILSRSVRQERQYAKHPVFNANGGTDTRPKGAVASYVVRQLRFLQVVKRASIATRQIAASISSSHVLPKLRPIVGQECEIDFVMRNDL